LDRRLVAAALIEASDELPLSDRGEAQAFARAVASSLKLEGIATTPEEVLEASKATQKP
jgi:hypothetical protein